MRLWLPIANSAIAQPTAADELGRQQSLPKLTNRSRRYVNGLHPLTGAESQPGLSRYRAR